MYDTEYYCLRFFWNWMRGFKAPRSWLLGRTGLALGAGVLGPHEATLERLAVVECILDYYLDPRHVARQKQLIL